MSATFEAAYFASYFSARLSDGLMVPPIIKVGGSPHPVHIFYLDDIRRIGEVCLFFLNSVDPMFAVH